MQGVKQECRRRKDGWTEQEFLWRTGSSTEERFAGTDWTDSPLRDDGRMPLPYVPLCAGFSLKVFYLLLHQPAAPDRQMTHSGGAHAVNERARPCLYETELLHTCRQLQIFGLWVTWSAKVLKTFKPISKTRTMWTDGVTRLKRGRSFETVVTVLQMLELVYNPDACSINQARKSPNVDSSGRLQRFVGEKLRSQTQRLTSVYLWLTYTNHLTYLVYFDTTQKWGCYTDCCLNWKDSFQSFWCRGSVGL